MIKGGYGPFDYRSYDTTLILHLWRFVTLPEQRKPPKAQMFGKKDESKSDFVIKAWLGRKKD